jgi:hypothetical protein
MEIKEQYVFHIDKINIEQFKNRIWLPRGDKDEKIRRADLEERVSELLPASDFVRFMESLINLLRADLIDLDRRRGEKMEIKRADVSEKTS